MDTISILFPSIKLENLTAPTNTQSTPPFANSINELRSLSTALSTFLNRFDELNNHLNFINLSIDAKLPSSSLVDDSLNPNCSPFTRLIESFCDRNVTDVSERIPNGTVSDCELMSENVRPSDLENGEIDSLDPNQSPSLIESCCDGNVTDVTERNANGKTVSDCERRSELVSESVRPGDLEEDGEIDSLNEDDEVEMLKDCDEIDVSKKVMEIDTDVLKDSEGIDVSNKILEDVVDMDVSKTVMETETEVLKDFEGIDVTNKILESDYDVLKDSEGTDVSGEFLETDTLKVDEEIDVSKSYGEIDVSEEFLGTDTMKIDEEIDVSNKVLETDTLKIGEETDVSKKSLETDSDVLIDFEAIDVAEKLVEADTDVLKDSGGIDVSNKLLVADTDQSKNSEEADTLNIDEEIDVSKKDAEIKISMNHEEISKEHDETDVLMNQEELDSSMNHEEVEISLYHEEISKEHEENDIFMNQEEIDTSVNHEEVEISMNHDEIDTLNQHEEADLSMDHEENDSLKNNVEAEFSKKQEEIDTLKKQEETDVVKKHEEIVVSKKSEIPNSLKKHVEADISKKHAEVHISKNPLEIDMEENDVSKKHEETDDLKKHEEIVILRKPGSSKHPKKHVESVVSRKPKSSKHPKKSVESGKPKSSNNPKKHVEIVESRKPESPNSSKKHVEIVESKNPGSPNSPKKHEEIDSSKKLEKIGMSKNPVEIDMEKNDVSKKKHEETNESKKLEYFGISKKLEIDVSKKKKETDDLKPKEIDVCKKHEENNNLKKLDKTNVLKKHEKIVVSKTHEEIDTLEKSVDSELETLCARMGPKELKKYVITHITDINKLREELPKALKLAEDPAKLVLVSIGRFFLQNSKQYHGRNHHDVVLRLACVMILECFVIISSDGIEISKEDKAYAAASALRWKQRMDKEGGVRHMEEVDARGLLLLISGFGIRDCDFKIVDIKDLIMASNVKGISAALRRSIILIPKIPEVIDMMVKNNLEIEAVDTVYIFGLEDKCHPLIILTRFLRKIIRDVQNGSPSQNLMAMKQQLPDLKAVKQCLEFHKVDPSYHLPDFKINERIEYLEKEINNRNLTPKRKSTEPGILGNSMPYEAKRACFSHANMPHVQQSVGHYPMNPYNRPAEPHNSYSNYARGLAHSYGTHVYVGAVSGQVAPTANVQPYGSHGNPPYSVNYMGQPYSGQSQTYISQPYGMPQLGPFPGYPAGRAPASDLYSFADKL